MNRVEIDYVSVQGGLIRPSKGKLTFLHYGDGLNFYVRTFHHDGDWWKVLQLDSRNIDLYRELDIDEAKVMYGLED